MTKNIETSITSSEIVAAFASFGIKVRVRQFPRFFRVCGLVSTDDVKLAATCVGVETGLVGPNGRLGECVWNGSREWIGYKPEGFTA
jgi:hypothetical protein